jgi:hypothetical protein
LDSNPSRYSKEGDVGPAETLTEAAYRVIARPLDRRCAERAA